jgi:monoamine oxidase
MVIIIKRKLLIIILLIVGWTRAQNDGRIYDILIVGAGISGLAAADNLIDSGKDILVLEARDRIGGRIWSHLWNGVIIEEGANWIHTSDGNPITEFAEKHGFTTYETPLNSMVAYLNGKEIDNDEYDYLVKEFWSYIIANQEKGQDESLANTISNFKLEKSFQFDEKMVINYLANSEISNEYGADLTNLSRDYFDIGEDYGDGELVLPNGLQQLTDVLKDEVDIRLNHIVTKIEYQDGRVIVYANNKKFHAKKVLVTVPLGVLKSGDIEFIPPLPISKQNAISKLGMGLLQKHWLLFDEVYWDEDVVWILPVNEQNWECMNYTYTGKPILLCFTMGEYAKNQESLPDSAITSDIMNVLRNTYGQNIPNPIDVHFTKWASDKFSYGAYSFTAVGNTPETYYEISAPIVNLIYFAGEHTHENYPATIHGAYLSGIRAAQSMK